MKKWLNLGWLQKITKTHLMIGALFGVLLLVMVIPTTENKKEKEEIKSGQVTQEYTQAEYQKRLEEQLVGILQQMDGVGKVQVMITLKDEGTVLVEKDKSGTKENGINEETVYSKIDSDQVPFVSRQITPKVEGVLVVAQGAGNVVVVKNISEVLEALFSIEVHKIKVVKMSE